MIRKAKRGSYKAAKTKNVYVNTYAFFPLKYFYDPADNLPKNTTLIEGPVDKTVNSETIKVNGSAAEFGTNYFVNGGGTLVADVSKYGCKKLSLHAGVSSASKTNPVTYTTRVDSDLIPGFSGTRTKANIEQYFTFTSRSKTGKDKAFRTLRIYAAEVAPEDFVADDPETAQVDESIGARDARLMIGNPKVFCMFPHVDPLHP